MYHFSCIASLFVFISIFMSSSLLFAYPKLLCTNKILDSGETSCILTDVEEQENRCYAVFKIGDEDWYLDINCGDKDKYIYLKNKPVNVKYQLEQYWDEHDEECVRQECLISLTSSSRR